MKKTEVAITMNLMLRWYEHLFDAQKNSGGFVRCFECGGWMHEDIYKTNPCCYSHILPKKPYPQYKGNPKNVKIVHPDCHNLYEMNPEKAKNQWKLKLELLEKHKNGEL